LFQAVKLWNVVDRGTAGRDLPNALKKAYPIALMKFYPIALKRAYQFALRAYHIALRKAYPIGCVLIYFNS